MRKSFSIAILLAAALLGSSRTGRAEDERPRLVDALHTAVADAIITYQQIELEAARDDEALRFQYQDKPTEALMRAMSDIRRDILTNMVNYQVVLHEFKNMEKTHNAKVSETIIDEEIRQVIREKYADDRVAFAKDLRNKGLTLEQYRLREREDLITLMMRNQFVPEPIISPRKVENYYVANQKKYQIEDQVKFRRIQLDHAITETDGQTKKRADEILSQIKGGADFAEMAKSYSDGTQRKDGGLSDWQDVSVLNDALKTELNKLKPGEVSPVIEAPNGCFILRLEERRPAHVKPLNDVRDEIERDLVRQERQVSLEKWYGRLRKKTYIQSF